MERMYTETEAKRIAVDAAQEALRRFVRDNPSPSCVSATEAAKMLNVSTKTIARMNLPRNKAGKIPYSAILDAVKR